MRPSQTPPSPDPDSPSGLAPEAVAADGAGCSPGHNFDVQKDLHRKIRNDPDYDDWEYGTEPLPHEAWVARQRQQAS